MRAVESMGCVRRVQEGIETLHAEITVETGEGLLFAQAHDNGVGRYYCLSRVSYFDSGREQDEDILEEYSGRPERESESADADFLSFLGEWGRQQEEIEDRPYTDSPYAMFYDMADRMLDDYSLEAEEEIQLS